jgi:hypothetical protein
LKKTILAVTAAAALLVPVAQAATPAKSSSFQYCAKPNSCPFGFNTNDKGTRLVNIMLFTKCNGELASFPTIKVKSNGKFEKTGTALLRSGDKLNFTIKGQFKKPKKAVGTYKLTAKGCTDKAHDFVAKRVGKAAQG